jgi:hydrogenase nickel incorporation protein HypB
MASPGAGKTSLILRTIEVLRGRFQLGVIEGDLAGRLDADKVAATGTPVIQINTGGNCHLDAPQIRSALDQLPLEDLDLLLIENMGNLVCPAAFALGEHDRAVIASVPEGHDKPIKYPSMFIVADAWYVIWLQVLARRGNGRPANSGPSRSGDRLSSHAATRRHPPGPV